MFHVHPMFLAFYLSSLISLIKIWWSCHNFETLWTYLVFLTLSLYLVLTIKKLNFVPSWVLSIFELISASILMLGHLSVISLLHHDNSIMVSLFSFLSIQYISPLKPLLNQMIVPQNILSYGLWFVKKMIVFILMHILRFHLEVILPYLAMCCHLVTPRTIYLWITFIYHIPYHLCMTRISILAMNTAISWSFIHNNKEIYVPMMLLLF